MCLWWSVPWLGLTNCVLHVDHLRLIEECLNFCLERDNRYLISLILALRRIISSGHWRCVSMALFYSTGLYSDVIGDWYFGILGFLIPSFLQNEEVLANNHHKRHWDDHACKYSYGWSYSASFCSEDDKNTCICRSCQYNMCVKEEPISAERAFKNYMFNGIKFVEIFFTLQWF